ncbi:MAG TPA: response regulator [Planctomycetota bacterium]|nr:response regulator [Planctomycetota bacterium]
MKPGDPLVRLLIVDDEERLMKALCETLKDHGYETVGFTSAQSALEALRDRKFDLLLSDLMMPEMDGVHFLKEGMKMDPSMVGIIMTGAGTVASAVEAMKAGALDYILKPFKLSAILPVLSRALTVKRLRTDNAELESRLRDRAAELEAANSELESFSYSVSHDLRAPLRAIGGFSHILAENHSDQLPAEGQRLLELVIQSVDRMDQLIKDLLRMSQLGRQPLAKRNVRMSALVAEVLHDLKKEQGDRADIVRVADLSDAECDPGLLKQVFTNLLSNAVKFTRLKEHPTVEVGCRKEGQDQVYFVRDNGAGFDMKYSEKLFAVFQRLHSQKDFEGTGVGLSIVHRIIQRHGGRVWAEGKVDEGATFYFSLPRSGERSK